MSNGRLYQLRQDWMRENKVSSVYGFLNGHGAAAVFKHIGIDSENTPRGRVYHAAVYAVFDTAEGKRVPFTLTELELLGQLTQSHGSPAIRANMNEQLRLASIDLAVNMPLAREKAAGAHHILERHNRITG